MRTYRALALFIILSLSFVAVVRIHRVRQEHRARQSVARALSGPRSGAVADVEGLAVPEPSPVSALLAGAPEYLWIQEAIVRGVQDVQVPVDVSVRRVLWAASGASSKCHLAVQSPAGPGGSSPSPAALRSYEVPSGVVFAINAPAPGLWTLHVEAKDHVLLFGRAVSEFGFDELRWADGVTLLQPGQTLRGRARFSGVALSSVTFVMIGQDGIRIPASVQAKRVTVIPTATPGRHVYDYAIALSIPGASFRLMAIAVDKQGRSYQRVYHTLFQPQD